VGVQVVGDVGGVHDPGQAHQRRVTVEVVIFDEDLEGAFAVAVGVAGAGGVEADGVFTLGCVEDLVGGDVEDLGIGVDELGDQPGAGDPVGLGPGAGDPLHDGSWGVGAGCGDGSWRVRPGRLR